MHVFETNLSGVKRVQTRCFEDQRGFFSETYNVRQFADHGIDADFVQDNHSFSRRRGTIRGLHFQIPPHAQAKLVRVLRGAIYDVAVDLRTVSPTYGRSVSVELSAENREQLFIPAGFAHGFCTLEDDTEVLYKVDAYYAPDCERGLLWNDPALNIDWPVDEAKAILSDKDRTYPPLSDLPAYFYLEA